RDDHARRDDAPALAALLRRRAGHGPRGVGRSHATHPGGLARSPCDRGQRRAADVAEPRAMTKRGFTLIEVAVAVAVLGMAGLALQRLAVQSLGTIERDAARARTLVV